jgi:RimJ/RimL family protein N-acetyltransferase
LLPKRITLGPASCQLSFELDQRDSDILGLPVFHLLPLSAGLELGAFRILDEQKVAMGEINAGVLTCRVPADSFRLIDSLESIGFRHMETTLHPRLEVDAAAATNQPSIDISLATESDSQDLLQIAAESFKVTRFHRDPLIDNGRADSRFSHWVNNALVSGQQEVFAFRVTGASGIAGFFVVRRHGPESFWELTAISSDFRGKGLSRLIWEAFIQFERERGVKVIRSNISAENLRVVTLYPRLGFSYESVSQVLHLHSAWMR